MRYCTSASAHSRWVGSSRRRNAGASETDTVGGNPPQPVRHHHNAHRTGGYPWARWNGIMLVLSVSSFDSGGHQMMRGMIAQVFDSQPLTPRQKLLPTTEEVFTAALMLISGRLSDARSLYQVDGKRCCGVTTEAHAVAAERLTGAPGRPGQPD